jgi:hypothetical protein
MTFIHLHRCVETPWNREESYIRERLDGKPRNITIQPRIHEVAVMLAVAGFIGFCIAVTL